MIGACTIIAGHQLGAARVLAESFFTHHPDGSFTVLVVDDEGRDIAPGGELDRPVTWWRLADLGLDTADRIGEAAVCYAKAMHVFDTMAQTTGLRDFDDGRAAACEGLALVELKRDQPMIAHALRGKIARLRVTHSHWPQRLSDGDIEFYCLWQHLPNPREPMTKLVNYNILDRS